jgi:uncharacterized repeat protein (TIGR03803 family)
LHSFDSTDGDLPSAVLVQAPNGNFYGTAPSGGEAGCWQQIGCGVIFEVTRQGTFTILHAFTSSDGGNPWGGLVQSTAGNFYGTTEQGGISNMGTVFKLDVGLGPFITFVRFAGEIGQTGPILGRGFTGATSVELNGVAADFTVVSNTFIRATVPVGGQTGYVTVTTLSGTLSSNVPFHVIP